MCAACAKRPDLAPVGCPTTSAESRRGEAAIQICGPEDRRELARLIESARASTDSVYLWGLIRRADYPDPEVARAAMRVASDSAATLRARTIALQIVARQMFGPGVSVAVMNMQMQPISAEQFTDLRTAWCNAVIVDDRALTIGHYPDPAPETVILLRQRATELARTANVPAVRNLSRCLVGER